MIIPISDCIRHVSGKKHHGIQRAESAQQKQAPEIRQPVLSRRACPSLQDVISDDKLVQVPLGQTQGIQNPFTAAFKRPVFHFNACEPIIADVRQR